MRQEELKKKTRIIDKILKQLTPERIKAENEAIQRVKLPPELQKWVQEYEKVGERNDYIWKWLFEMFQVIQLPTVPKKYQASLWEIKVLVTMFIVLLDDVADKEKRMILLQELLKVPFEQKHIETLRLNHESQKYLDLARKIWNYILAHIKRYPHYKEMETIFSYDLRQVLNAIRYSCLLNRHIAMINKTEGWIYMPYNMVSLVYSGLDLMCFPRFDFAKLGRLREIILEAQKMARIGNWISTWEREVGEKDFASGIFMEALNSKILSLQDLQQKESAEIIKIIKKTKIEEGFLREWEGAYHNIQKLGKDADQKQFTNIFLKKLERLIVFHLFSRGYK